MKSLLTALLMMLAGLAQAADFLPVDDAFQLTVERQGDELHLNWQIADNYYLYRNQHRLNPLDGAEVGPAQLSPGSVEKYDVTFDERLAVYYDRMSAVYPVLTDSGRVEVVYQGCADAGLCYPPQKRLFSIEGVALENRSGAAAFSSPAGSLSLIDSAPSSAANSSLASVTLAGALLFAMLGGLILNLMPCVFPVLSLKALQLAQSSDSGRERLIAHGWVYTAGVVLSFIGVALLLLVLRALGAWVGWGFQLQSPGFVAALVLLFFVLALAMSGFIEIGGRLMGLGQSWTQRPGWSGSFFTGVLATLVATPCTAPFMGTAIAFALAQPAAVSLTIFAVMGLGMALPILLLTYMPALGRRLPKPGPWMLTFRQLMAFPLFATVLWLLWVLVELTVPLAVFSVGLGLLVLTLVAWSGRWSARLHRRGLWLLGGARLLGLALALLLVFDQPEPDTRWEPYDAASLERYQNNGQAVFLDVTAAWCITCKANERVALSGDDFDALVERSGVRLMRADWTRPSPAVDALIEGFGRDGVPLYVYYPASGAAPRVLPQLLTPSLVRAALSVN